MFPEWNRRSFVQTLFASAAHLSLAASGVAQTRPAAAQPQPGPQDPAYKAQPGPKDPTLNVPLAVTTLTDTVTLIAGAGGNVVLSTSPTARRWSTVGPERSDELMRWWRRGRWEAGHDALQHRLASRAHRLERGARRNPARRSSRTSTRSSTWAPRSFVEWQKRTYKPMPQQALPTKTFYTTGSMTVGSERLEYGHLGQAHTDGDIYVLLSRRERARGRRRADGGKVSDRRLHDRRMAGRPDRRRRRRCSISRTPTRAWFPGPGRCRRAPICRPSTTCSRRCASASAR